jgi:hypothetical protein
MSKSIGMLLILALSVSLLLSTDLLTDVSSQTSSSETVSAPAIEWQKNYGSLGSYDDSNVEFASNLIQTNDGGYVFMNLGWSYYWVLQPATVFKVDSSGSLQWNKTVEGLKASTIIQTSDEGYEIAGQWFMQGLETPTLIKMSSQGNIPWNANYSSVPELSIPSKAIQTSDGGFVYWTDWSINKTDSNNNTQWVKNLTYTGREGTAPLELFSVIETSDGALAALGVGRDLLDNYYTGKIYLIKTEAFLPLPSQVPLPTPIQTPLPALTVEAVVTVSLIVGVDIVSLGLLLYFKKRKH